MTDHIGSSNVITDETGQVVQILEYTPFGEVSRNTGNYSTDKRFTGKIWDEVSALLYFGARYYDPELGRFITADPTIAHPFDPQDLNRYSYCRNNPVNYIDPTGYSWWSKFWDWVMGAAAVVIMVVTAVATLFTGGPASPLAPVLIGEFFGALGGAAGAAMSGGGIGAGMLAGTIAGGITGGVIGPGSSTSTTITETITNSWTKIGSGDMARWVSSTLITRTITTTTQVLGNAAAIAVFSSGVAEGATVINGMVSTAYASETNNRANKTGWSICPRYGNWGGLDWSGGKEIRAGEIGPLDVEPMDSMDALFKEHDINVYEVLHRRGISGAERLLLRHRFDTELYGNVMGLPDDPSSWSMPAPDPAKARKYREKVEWWFGDVQGSRREIL